jgi:rubrerythrin
VNWPLFFSTFALVFLAELGDKTQLAVMSQSAASSSKWTVFAAGALALAAATAVGVLAGALLRRFVPDERYIKCAGGALFLVFGCLMLKGAFFPKVQGAAASARGASAEWTGRFVLQQAVIFEQSACQDYMALARRSLDPAEKAVFEWLAREERWHHEAMLSAIAAGADSDIPITPEMAEALPPMADLMHGAAGAAKEVERAVEHERAMARFYRAVSEKSTIPRLRDTFEALAVAEENHARRLIALGARD